MIYRRNEGSRIFSRVYANDMVPLSMMGRTESPGEGNDEYTKLLIHSDHSDGSTVFTDSSASEHTLTTVGVIKHSTDKYKFGASSIYYGIAGTQAGISLPDVSDFLFSVDPPTSPDLDTDRSPSPFT